MPKIVMAGLALGLTVATTGAEVGASDLALCEVSARLTTMNMNISPRLSITQMAADMNVTTTPHPTSAFGDGKRIWIIKAGDGRTFASE